MQRSRAFTLIELLVVIAIIAIMAAILFPVFAGVREEGRKTACLSNTKQIAYAQIMYAQDFDDMIVPWVIGPWSPEQPELALNQHIWTDLLQPYLKNRQVYFCPGFSEGRLFEAASAPDCWGVSASDVRAALAGYRFEAHYGIEFPAVWGDCSAAHPRVAMAGGGWAGQGFVWMTLSAIQRPAETANFAEGYTVRQTAPPWLIGITQGCEGARRHRNGQNIVFVDGHAKWAVGNPEAYPAFDCGPATIGDQSYSKCLCSRYMSYDK